MRFVNLFLSSLKLLSVSTLSKYALFASLSVISSDAILFFATVILPSSTEFATYSSSSDAFLSFNVPFKNSRRFALISRSAMYFPRFALIFPSSSAVSTRFLCEISLALSSSESFSVTALYFSVTSLSSASNFSRVPVFTSFSVTLSTSSFDFPSSSSFLISSSCSRRLISLLTDKARSAYNLLSPSAVASPTLSFRSSAFRTEISSSIFAIISLYFS